MSGMLTAKWPRRERAALCMIFRLYDSYDSEKERRL